MTELNLPLSPSILRRFGSLIYELLLLISISFVPMLLIAIIVTVAKTSDLVASLASTIGLFIVWQWYFRYAWLKTGQTLPMKVWRLRVENLQGCLLGKKQSWIRFLWSMIFLVLIPSLSYSLIRKLGFSASISFCLGMLWCVLPWGYALFDPDKQFLYDRLSGSRIVLLPKGKK